MKFISVRTADRTDRERVFATILRAFEQIAGRIDRRMLPAHVSAVLRAGDSRVRSPPSPIS